MASYEEARQAGYIGDYGSGLSNHAGFYDGMREAEEHRRNPGASGGGLNPLAAIALFLQACFVLAVVHGIIASVAAAFVIAGATRLFARSAALGPVLRASYAASVWAETAWVLFTLAIMLVGSVLRIESHANLARALSALSRGAAAPHGFSWSSLATVSAVLSIVGPGVLAHAAVLSRQLGAPFAGVVGYLRAVVVSAVAIPVGVSFVVALVLTAVWMGIKVHPVEYPLPLLESVGVYLLIDVVGGAVVATVVFRIAARRARWVTWPGAYKTALVCLAVHVLVTATIICAKVHIVAEDPVLQGSKAILGWIAPWHRLPVQGPALRFLLPTLILAQVPGLIVCRRIIKRELAVRQASPVRPWPPVVIALAFVGVANVALPLIVTLLPVMKLSASFR